MKKTRDIESEILSIEKESRLYLNRHDKQSEREYNKLERRVVFLRQMKRYSELSSYTEDSLKAQLSDLEGLTERLTETFEKHKKPYVEDVKEAWRKFRRDNNMAQIDKQIKTIKYLLQ